MASTPHCNNATLLTQMKSRFEKISQAKEANLAKDTSLDQQLRRLFKNPPKRPNLTIPEIEGAMAKQEHVRNTTSMSLQNEKRILRELEQLQERKAQVLAYNTFQSTVHTLKTEREECGRQLTAYQQQLQELTIAIQKMTLAVTLDCSVTSFETIEMIIPMDRMGMVVGKGGSKIQKIEIECGVLIDRTRSGQTKDGLWKITGPPANLQRAQKAIETITLARKHSISLSQETIKLLLSQKAKLLHDLEQKYNVQIDLDRQHNKLHVVTTPTIVHTLENAFNELSQGMVEIDLPSEIIPKLIGKNGETITQLMEDTGCFIDLEKQRVRLQGTRESVEMAQTFIQALITSQSIHERVFSVPTDISIFSPSKEYEEYKFHFFIEFLLLQNAAQLKLLRQDASNAHILLQRNDDALLVKGTNTQLCAMEQALRERVRVFESHHRVLELEKEQLHCLPLIIGKKGVKMQAIESTSVQESDASVVKVEILQHRIGILSDTLGGVDCAFQKIQAVVDANHRHIISLAPHLVMILLQNKREKLIEIESQCIGCKFQLPPMDGRTEEETAVPFTLIGSIQVITMAEGLIRAMEQTYQVQYLPLDNDEVPLVIGKKGETIGQLEGTSGARLRVIRTADTNELKMIGTKEQLSIVQNELDTILHTGYKQVVVLDAFTTGCLIGKKGERIQAFRLEHPNATIDAYPARGQVRVKAISREALDTCIVSLERLLRDMVVQEVVSCPHMDLNKVLKTIPALHMRLYELQVSSGGDGIKVVISEDGHVVRIRGSPRGVSLIRSLMERVVATCADASVLFEESIELPLLAFASAVCVKGSLETLNENALRITRTTHCSLRVQKTQQTTGPEAQILVQGPTIMSVYEARDQVRKVLKFYYTECYHTIENLPLTAVTRLYEQLPRDARAVLCLETKTSLTVCSSSCATTKSVVQILKQALLEWKQQHVEVPIPVWLAPMLVGKNGEMIKKLKAKTPTVTFELEPHGSGSGSLSRVLVICGRDETAVQAAVKNVENFILTHQQETMTLFILKTQVEMVSSMKKRLPSTLTIHLVDHVSDGEAKVQVIVIGGDIAQRQQWVDKIEQTLRTQVVEKVQLPLRSSSIIGALIGKNGAHMKALQKEFPRVSIDIHRAESQVELQGPQDDVIRVKRVMDDKVLELVQQQQTIDKRVEQENKQQFGSDKMELNEEEKPIVDENTRPNQGYQGTIPVGMTTQTSQKLNKNQRRRLRNKAFKEKESDVLSMIMGGAENATPTTNGGADVSNGYYHSTNGYSLRL